MRRPNLTTGFLTAMFTAAVATSALAASPSIESVQLWDKSDGSQGMTVSLETVKAGDVTFEVTNVSEHEDHELLLLKTDKTPDQFELDDSGTRVDEEKLDGVKELGDLKIGETSKHMVALIPGRYLMFCNEPGHFGAGMYHELIVTP